MPEAVQVEEPAQAATMDERGRAGGAWRRRGGGRAGERRFLLALHVVGLARKMKEREIRGWQWAFCSQKIVPAPPAPPFRGVALCALAVVFVKSDAKRACKNAAGTLF